MPPPRDSTAIRSRSRPPLVQGLARLYGVAPDQVLVGRGSDEAIDLLLRVFCRAGVDNVIVCPPTFGMYRRGGPHPGSRGA